MLSSQSDIITCAQEVEMMIKQLEAQLEQLKLTVKSKTAVPTSQVFVSIGHQLWNLFKGEWTLKSHKIGLKVILIVFSMENVILVLYMLILFFLLILSLIIIELCCKLNERIRLVSSCYQSTGYQYCLSVEFLLILSSNFMRRSLVLRENWSLYHSRNSCVFLRVVHSFIKQWRFEHLYLLCSPSSLRFPTCGLVSRMKLSWLASLVT